MSKCNTSNLSVYNKWIIEKFSFLPSKNMINNTMLLYHQLIVERICMHYYIFFEAVPHKVHIIFFFPHYFHIIYCIYTIYCLAVHAPSFKMYYTHFSLALEHAWCLNYVWGMCSLPGITASFILERMLEDVRMLVVWSPWAGKRSLLCSALSQRIWSNAEWQPFSQIVSFNEHWMWPGVDLSTGHATVHCLGKWERFKMRDRQLIKVIFRMTFSAMESSTIAISETVSDPSKTFPARRYKEKGLSEI